MHQPFTDWPHYAFVGHHKHMVTFFHTRTHTSSTRNSLAFQHSVRRVLAIICAAISVFAALSCVRATVRTMNVITAIHTIERDAIITATDLAVRAIPYHHALDDAVSMPDVIAGMNAAVTIPQGSIVTFAMVSATPLLASDATTVRLALSSASGTFATGIHVRLVAAESCTDTTDSDSQASPASESTTQERCIVADDAIIMGPVETDDTGAALTPVGLDADDALRALSMHSPIVAVQR